MDLSFFFFFFLVEENIIELKRLDMRFSFSKGREPDGLFLCDRRPFVSVSPCLGIYPQPWGPRAGRASWAENAASVSKASVQNWRAWPDTTELLSADRMILESNL